MREHHHHFADDFFADRSAEYSFFADDLTNVFGTLAIQTLVQRGEQRSLSRPVNPVQHCDIALLIGSKGDRLLTKILAKIGNDHTFKHVLDCIFNVGPFQVDVLLLNADDFLHDLLNIRREVFE